MKDDLLDSALAIKINGFDPKEISLESDFLYDVETHWKRQKKRLYAQRYQNDTDL